jgi:aminoglycoside phosphotransferase (APT) family kinase protein
VADAAESLQRDLGALLRDHLGHAVEVSLPVQLSGGASKESWAFDMRDGATRTPLILRRDPMEGGAPGSPARTDHAVLDAMLSAGVPVPRVRWSGAVESWHGATYIVMERVEGETLAPRILRDPGFAAARTVLLTQAALALARIHSVAVAAVAPPLQRRSPAELLDEVQALLDGAPDPHPVFEHALRWMRRNLPPPTPPAPVHADFRMGNLIVGDTGLRAVLDWELAHVGDPARDLGYFCVRSWRFGVDDQPAGGLGTREQWLAAYHAAGGRPDVDIDALRWWELFGTTVWGAQTTHLAQDLRSVERAAIGRRAAEMEHDVLILLGASMHAPMAPADVHAAVDGSLQDSPSATRLLDVTAEFLQHEVMPQLTGRSAFHVRVAANVLRIVGREVALTPQHAAPDRAALATLVDSAGNDADARTLLAQLAARIRAGDHDARDAELRDVLAAITARKLAIANPRHLRGGGSGA